MSEWRNEARSLFLALHTKLQVDQQSQHTWCTENAKGKGREKLQQIGTGTGSLNRIPVTGNKTNDLDKEFHDIQKLLYNEGNCQVSEKVAIRMGEKSFLALHTTED